MPADFAAWYAALGLSPVASDDDIARAKRAYNELYHADRLAHMSAAARAIAEERVKAANGAAQGLLDPALRARRDAWVAAAPRVADSGPGPAHATADGESRGQASAPAAEPPAPGRKAAPGRGDRPRPVRSAIRVAFVAVVGTLLGIYAYVGVMPWGGRRGAAPAARESLPVETKKPAPGVSRPRTPARAAPPPALPLVVDSVIRLQGDGRWSAPVRTGGAAFRVAVFPEGPRANYRLRVDHRDVQAFLGQPVVHWDGAAATWEFATLTGTAARLRLSRWPADAPAGTVVHSDLVVAGAEGEWSARIWLGPLRLRWDPDRSATYEARDDRGRTFRLLPAIRSIVADPAPQWLQFRALDSLPLRLTLRYAVP